MSVVRYTAQMPWESIDRIARPEVERGWALIGAAVKRRREGLALTQRDLERRSGISQSAISRLENGRLRGMRWSRFARLVDAMDGLDFGVPTTRHWIGLDRRRSAQLAEESGLEGQNSQSALAVDIR